jgi:hypothetical protein
MGVDLQEPEQRFAGFARLAVGNWFLVRVSDTKFGIIFLQQILTPIGCQLLGDEILTHT